MQTVLIASLGGSPQVVTETIWAILNGKDRGTAQGLSLEERLPRKVHMIATSFLYGGPSVADAVAARQDCRQAMRKRIGQLYTQHNRMPLEDADVILDVVQHEGRDLDDIRTREENDSLARRIMEVVRDYSAEPDLRIHFSLAGGRKTMGSYAQTAMMLLGSLEDELSHVLVLPAKLENNRAFWWPGQSLPEQKKDFFEVRSPYPLDLPLDTRDAAIDLASVMFLPMRRILSPTELEKGLSLQSDPTMLADRIDSALSASVLRVDAANCAISIGNEPPIKLNPRAFAIYATAALAKKYSEAWPRHVVDPGGEPQPGWLSIDDLPKVGTKAFHVTRAIANTILVGEAYSNSGWGKVDNPKEHLGTYNPFSPNVSQIFSEIAKASQNPMLLEFITPRKRDARRKPYFGGIQLAHASDRIELDGISESAVEIAQDPSWSFNGFK